MPRPIQYCVFDSMLSPSTTETSTVWCFPETLLLASTSLALFDLVFLNSCLLFALFLFSITLLKPLSFSRNQFWCFLLGLPSTSSAASNAALLKTSQYFEILFLPHSCTMPYSFLILVLSTPHYKVYLD